MTFVYKVDTFLYKQASVTILNRYSLMIFWHEVPLKIGVISCTDIQTMRGVIDYCKTTVASESSILSDWVFSQVEEILRQLILILIISD